MDSTAADYASEFCLTAPSARVSELLEEWERLEPSDQEPRSRARCIAHLKAAEEALAVTPSQPKTATTELRALEREVSRARPGSASWKGPARRAGGIATKLDRLQGSMD